MGFLDKLLGKGDGTQVADLQRAFDKLSLGEAEAAVASLERERQALLLDGTDAQVAAMDERIAAANRQVERVSAAREALAARIAAVQVVEDDTGRRQRYDTAAKAQVAAAKALAAEYPKHARAIMALVRAIAEADALARAANEDLPTGSEPLPHTAEKHVRNAPDRIEGVVSEETFAAWCWPNGTRLSSVQLAQVEADNGATKGLWKSAFEPPRPVVLRRFRRVTSNSASAGLRAPMLAASLSLPGLHARHVDFWRPGQGGERPGGLVAAIDAAEQSWGKELRPAFMWEGSPVVEIFPLNAGAAD